MKMTKRMAQLPGSPANSEAVSPADIQLVDFSRNPKLHLQGDCGCLHASAFPGAYSLVNPSHMLHPTAPSDIPQSLLGADCHWSIARAQSFFAAC